LTENGTHAKERRELAAAAVVVVVVVAERVSASVFSWYSCDPHRWVSVGILGINPIVDMVHHPR
jgi:hypothetical protein